MRIFCIASSPTCRDHFSYKSHFLVPPDSIHPSPSWWSDVPAQTLELVNNLSDSQSGASHLNDCAENVHEGDEHEIVQSCRIGHFGEIFPGLQSHEGHSEDRGDTQRDPVRGGLSVEPEGDPRYDYQQRAGTINLEERNYNPRLQFWLLWEVFRKCYKYFKIPEWQNLPCVAWDGNLQEE